MKLLNFVSLVFFVTLIAFLYTHQNIETIKLGYEIQKNALSVNKLLDRREQLEYNVARLKAPNRLELQLAKNNVKLVLPERWQVVKAAALGKEKVGSQSPQFVGAIILGIFSLKSEAKATPAAD